MQMGWMAPAPGNPSFLSTRNQPSVNKAETKADK